MAHSVEEIERVKGVSRSAKSAHAHGGGFFRLVILSRPEGIVEADAEDDLLKGNEHRGNPVSEVFSGHSVGSFQNMFAGQEAEDYLQKGSQSLQQGSEKL